MLCGINITKKIVVVPAYPSSSPVSSMGPGRRRLCRPSRGERALSLLVCRVGLA
jgi:hypothetical protein